MTDSEGFSLQDILEILPHRYPFLLVDRVLERNKVFNGTSHAGSTIRVLKNVTVNEPFFPGHFPSEPVMPGVLLIEAMAQAAALLAYKPKDSGGGWMFYIVGVDKAKFRKKVVPGDSIHIEASLVKDRGTLFVFSCVARVDGKVAAEAEIMAKMV
jgi:3-hydroxyacyl-[acyl-carrier-protein] dehydratase